MRYHHPSSTALTRTAACHTPHTIKPLRSSALCCCRNASNSNARAASLASGLEALPGFSLLYPTQINMLHIVMPIAVLEGLQAEGFAIAARRLRPGDEEVRGVQLVYFHIPSLPCR